MKDEIIKYLSSKCKSLVDLFDAKANMGYDAFVNLYMIEVVPAEMYHSNADYAKWEMEVQYEFIDLFPGDELCFVTSDSLIHVDSPIMSFESVNCNDVTSANLRDCEFVSSYIVNNDYVMTDVLSTNDVYDAQSALLDYPIEVDILKAA